MTIDPEMLMAYADGELDPLTAKRVERAIAEDPALAEQVARHRMLAARLRDAFATVEETPVPASVEALLRESAKVVPIVPAPRRPMSAGWLGALAASLVAGLFLGQMLPRFGSEAGEIGIENGQPVARGALAAALDTQLASTQPAGSPVRIGVTFRDADGALCRTFEQDAVGGIACAARDGWRLARLYGGVDRQGNAYRQASSSSAAMMADAQAMMAGQPLDAEAEQQAIKDRSENR